jgi:hypothetical protein
MICHEDARTVALSGHGFSLTYRDLPRLTERLTATVGSSRRNATRTCEIRAFRSPPVPGIVTVIRPNKEGTDDERVQDKVRAYDERVGLRHEGAALYCSTWDQRKTECAELRADIRRAIEECQSRGQGCLRYR